MPQPSEATTADDPTRWLRRVCASGPQVHQYIPVRRCARRSRGVGGGVVRRKSALLALGPACRPDSKRHPCLRLGALHLKPVSASFICPYEGDQI